MTTKQRRFAEVYAGNGVTAAREAGYGGNERTLAVTAHHLLRNPNILIEIRARASACESNVAFSVATRLERQAFWTYIMSSDAYSMTERLRASELLAKSEGDFIKYVELDTSSSIVERLMEARQRASKHSA